MARREEDRIDLDLFLVGSDSQHGWKVFSAQDGYRAEKARVTLRAIALQRDIVSL